jgi:hypothetical protein
MTTQTTFIKLPENLRRPITGGCQCPFCKAHPHLIPQWDTLASGRRGLAWTVHYPELIAVESRIANTGAIVRN